MSLPDPRPRRLPGEPSPGLSEARQSGDLVYEGVLLKIHRDVATAADGHACIREYTIHPGAAAIVPLIGTNRVLMERQWRYPLNRSFLEFPAGKLDAGEPPLQAARRELQEETGYRARRWASLGPMHPVISYSTEVIHLFLADDLVAGESAREAGECLEVVEIGIDDLFARIQAGEVTDAKTLSAAF
ncbi:MAG TPA: NUDIX hydrolase, partial [Burkholderiaceae bacterium]|nr:NUDIX hydrolase [Burkholderiaceae bacterium]